MSEIASRVKAIIVDKLGVEESEVTNEASFTNDLGADSLDTVELIMEFEKEFSISIPDDQAAKIATVGDAVSHTEANAKSLSLFYNMELKRVVVTGLGALTPVGNTMPETWENIKKGVSGAGPITHFDASKFKATFACEVKNFNATEFIDRKEARKMDLYEQYALVAAMEAIKDCGWDLEKVDKNRIGVILGVGIGGIHTFEEEVSNRAKSGEAMGHKSHPCSFPK